MHPWAGIWDYLQRDWLLELRHVLRDINRGADLMASISLEQHEQHKEWHIAPRKLEHILIEDHNAYEHTRTQRVLCI